MGNRQVKTLHTRKIADDDYPFGEKYRCRNTNYADDTAEQHIIAWQTGPIKTVTKERWAQEGVEDVSQEKKNSYSIRVQHIKKTQ